MILTIHQPEHLPWLGFFHKVFSADRVVFLDTVQFAKRYFQSRNRVRSADGWRWITVPVKADRETKIEDVLIANEVSNWQRKWDSTIRSCYGKAKYFDDYYSLLSRFVNMKWKRLFALNVSLITLMSSMFKNSLSFTNVELASNLGVSGSKGDLILDICKKMGADVYLSGPFGRDYLDEGKFKKEGIEIRYDDFVHPVYKQVYAGFELQMSTIDLLFNCGPESYDILMGERG